MWNSHFRAQLSPAPLKREIAQWLALAVAIFESVLRPQVPPSRNRSPRPTRGRRAPAAIHEQENGPPGPPRPVRILLGAPGPPQSEEPGTATIAAHHGLLAPHEYPVGDGWLSPILPARLPRARNASVPPRHRAPNEWLRHCQGLPCSRPGPGVSPWGFPLAPPGASISAPRVPEPAAPAPQSIPPQNPFTLQATKFRST